MTNGTEWSYLKVYLKMSDVNDICIESNKMYLSTYTYIDARDIYTN